MTFLEITDDLPFLALLLLLVSVGLLVSGSHLIAVVSDVCDMHAISACDTCAWPGTTYLLKSYI